MCVAKAITMATLLSVYGASVSWSDLIPSEASPCKTFAKEKEGVRDPKGHADNKAEYCIVKIPDDQGLLTLSLRSMYSCKASRINE